MALKEDSNPLPHIINKFEHLQKKLNINYEVEVIYFNFGFFYFQRYGNQFAVEITVIIFIKTNSVQGRD